MRSYTLQIEFTSTQKSFDVLRVFIYVLKRLVSPGKATICYCMFRRGKMDCHSVNSLIQSILIPMFISPKQIEKKNLLFL